MGLVEAIVREQHPDFLAALSFVANGWDSAIYRLGEQHIVRLPRRLVGVPLIENEQRWLPGIAQRMPVAVPTPLAIGTPSARYPWPWTIATWFDGTPVDELEADTRDCLAVDLAAAVIALHLPAPEDAPRNPVRGVPLAQRHEVVLLRLDAAGLDAASNSAVREAWNAGMLASPHEGPLIWLHGDLHPGNAIAGVDGRLSAIIDFGDLCAGDPAGDLSAAWLFFGPAGRELFRAAIGDRYDSATWIRARAWASSFALALLSDSDGSERMAAIARHTIAQLREE